MNCKNCGVSFDKKPLHRTNPKGQSDAGWMCLDCIEKKEPELAGNIKEDGQGKLIDILSDWQKDINNP